MHHEPAAWLETGVPELDAVLGSPSRGIPYGRIMELFGLESHGKTALALFLAAMAQKDRASIIWGDFESSFDPTWATRRGLEADKVLVFRPFVGQFGKEKEPRLATAQELCEEIETAMALCSAKPNARTVVVADSLTAMLVEGESAGGLVEQNLRTNMALPAFLGKLLRRWVGLAQSHSVLIILINQLRQNPMKMFGDPWYTPGGNAPKFYSHIRAKVRRIKNGRILRAGKIVGLKGAIVNMKNKVGGVEGSTIGYRMLFDGPVEFLPVKELECEGTEE